MRRLDTITGSADRMRIGQWRGDPAIALLSPIPGAPPSRERLEEAIDEARSRGFLSVLTPALSVAEQPVFFNHGFFVHERLHLLGHALSSPLPSLSVSGLRMRRARPRDIRTVLAIDQLAFDDFWQFNMAGLLDARAATPRSRFRVAIVDNSIVGYHVTGSAGSFGYLQRLAVHPEFHGRGIGTALIGDSLDWCAKRNCVSVLVNTQESNHRALSLYRSLGFTSEPTGLAVLSRSIDGMRQ